MAEDLGLSNWRCGPKQAQSARQRHRRDAAPAPVAAQRQQQLHVPLRPGSSARVEVELRVAHIGAFYGSKAITPSEAHANHVWHLRDRPPAWSPGCRGRGVACKPDAVAPVRL